MLSWKNTWVATMLVYDILAFNPFLEALNFSLLFGSDSQLLVYNPNIYRCSIPAAFRMELIHMPQLCAGSSSSEIPDSASTSSLRSGCGLPQAFLLPRVHGIPV